MPRVDRNVSSLDDYVLLTGRANSQLAYDIGKILKRGVYAPITSFADGEIRVKGLPNLRQRHIFIIQPTSPQVNDNLMELLFMIDAAKRASAREITAIIPYFGYSRQDRKELPRVPISASLVASLIQHAGAHAILTVDIHSEQQEGFIEKPWDNLYASYSLLPVIKSKKLANLVTASPDKGGMIRATGYARLLGATGLAIVYKERDVKLNNVSSALGMIGEVKGKNVLLIDDMIDTAGTIVNAANYIKKQGATSVRVAATHGLFSSDALEKIDKSAIEEVFITDSVMLPEKVLKHKKITVASIAPLLAEAIKRVKSGESISKDLLL